MIIERELNELMLIRKVISVAINVTQMSLIDGNTIISKFHKLEMRVEIFFS